MIFLTLYLSIGAIFAAIAVFVTLQDEMHDRRYKDLAEGLVSIDMEELQSYRWAKRIVYHPVFIAVHVTSTIVQMMFFWLIFVLIGRIEAGLDEDDGLPYVRFK